MRTLFCAVCLCLVLSLKNVQHILQAINLHNIMNRLDVCYQTLQRIFFQLSEFQAWKLQYRYTKLFLNTHIPHVMIIFWRKDYKFFKSSTRGSVCLGNLKETVQNQLVEHYEGKI